ncbi:MAG: hypothetical protein RID09_23695 [Coleofasciculus sp. G1-WW12-02]|uniref:hypothetical protein n=1 Tax=Coleofasciculus sp. G1-WW12-02 TaxID=3068483 RepID=UPI0032F111FB
MAKIYIADIDVENRSLMEELSSDELELTIGGFIVSIGALAVASFSAGVALYAAVKN